MRRATPQDIAKWRRMRQDGMNNKQIAQKTGFGERTIRRRLNESVPSSADERASSPGLEEAAAPPDNSNGRNAPKRAVAQLRQEAPQASPAEEAEIAKLFLAGKKPEQIVAAGHGTLQVKETLERLAEMRGLTDRPLYQRVESLEEELESAFADITELKETLEKLGKDALRQSVVSSWKCDKCGQVGKIRVILRCTHKPPYDPAIGFEPISCQAIYEW